VTLEGAATQTDIDLPDERDLDRRGGVDVFLGGARKRAAATTDPLDLLSEGAFEAGALEEQDVDLGITEGSIDVEGAPPADDLAEAEDVLEDAGIDF
jgi:hypothetical protein